MDEQKKRAALAAKKLTPLALGSIHPTGWLRKQLLIQANGLSGHLDEFWPDVADSSWIGGKAEGWERGPYWLDGVVPLAFGLDDERLKAKVQHWMDYVLGHQQEDGWLGPVLDKQYGYEYDPWPIYVMLKAMTQFYEATKDARVIPAMKRFLRRLDTLLAERPLKSWAKMRWHDLLLSIQWLYERCEEEWLLALAHKLHEQGFNWSSYFIDYPYKEKSTVGEFESHGVNCAMAVKEPALWYRHSQLGQDLAAVERIMQTLDTYHGQATGMFSCDEIVAGKNPSQGSELCAVVEYQFSLEVALTVLGDVSLADRLERLTFNTLPAILSEDMWAHQYDGQANQVICSINEDRIYTTNGPDANIFGLEPHFGCCTANMHQGWPKFVSHLWMKTPDEGLAAIAYAPCHVDTQVGDVPVHIEVETEYPFEETVRVTVAPARPARFPLLLRIPGWAKGATLALAGEEKQEVAAGTFHLLEREWSAATEIVLHFPMTLQTSTRYHGSVALERGPLVYSLQIGEEWRQVGRELPAADWEVHPTTPWNYALQIDREEPERGCVMEARRPGERPFGAAEVPVLLHVKGRRVPEWKLEHNAAGPLPYSPVHSAQPLEDLTLVPYGCARLRITEFPTLAAEK